MQVEHAFFVPLPVAEAWDVLLDVDRIGPCLPGATVEKFDGETVEGHVKVKLGPIQVNYVGTATFVERDPTARRVVVEAKGTETRGEGTALATLVAELHDSGSRMTEVRVVTELSLTGRPAQFSRSVLVAVGQRLVDRFSQALGAQLDGSRGTVASPVATASRVTMTAPRRLGPLPTAPTPTVGEAREKVRSPRSLLAVGGALLALVIGWRVSRRRR